MHIRFRLASAVLFFTVASSSLWARDQIHIVGSTSVYPFSTLVAERIGQMTQYKTPVVETTGTGGGIKAFCAGAGKRFPDIVNTSRAMTAEEIKACRKNGVGPVFEIKIGLDGIVVGRDLRGEDFALTRKQLFLALAERVPDKDGNWILNPYKKWNEIDPALPNKQIMVLGPTPTLATREVFEELVIKEGCRQAGGGTKMCKQPLREDGAFIEVAEHDNVTVQRLRMNPQAIGIFSFGFLLQNQNKVAALAIDGVKPSVATIASKQYPISRPMYFYIKKAHVDLIPGITEYAREFLSQRARGPNGYLTQKGLVQG